MPTEPDPQTEQLDPSEAGGTLDYQPKPTLAMLPEVGGDVVARQRVAGKSN